MLLPLVEGEPQTKRLTHRLPGSRDSLQTVGTMHRRNPSLDRISSVMGGGGGGGGGGGKENPGGSGFSYGATPPLTQHLTASTTSQQQRQKYNERSRNPHGEFSESVESLNQQDPASMTPVSSTSTLPNTNSRPQTYSPSTPVQARHDPSYFPPTPPPSIRIATPTGTTRGSHTHSTSQQSLSSDRNSSRSSIALNGLFNSVGAGPGAAKKAASSIYSRFTLSSLMGSGGDKEKVRQGSVEEGHNRSQLQQQQLQSLMQEEELLQDGNAPLPPLLPPTSQQFIGEWADQSEPNSFLSRSVASVHSEAGQRTPIALEEGGRSPASAGIAGVQSLSGMLVDGQRSNDTSGDRLSGSRGSSIVYDQDVNLEYLIGSHSPQERREEGDVDDGGSTSASITPSVFRRNRQSLEGTGIATGQSTLLGQLLYTQGKLVRVDESGSVKTVASMGTRLSSDSFPLFSVYQDFLDESQDPISPLKSTSMQLPSPMGAQQEIGTILATNSKRESVKRTSSSSSTMSQVKRKPSPLMPVVSSQPSLSTPPGPNLLTTESEQNVSPELAQGVIAQPPIIRTGTPTAPALQDLSHSASANIVTSPLTNNASANLLPAPWGQRTLQMEISQVELPPPPHSRSPLSESPLSAIEIQKKEWAELERDVVGEGDAPPPPYVARASMLATNSEEGQGDEVWEDEKTKLQRGALNRRSIKLYAQTALTEKPIVVSLKAGGYPASAGDDGRVQAAPLETLQMVKADEGDELVRNSPPRETGSGDMSTAPTKNNSKSHHAVKPSSIATCMSTPSLHNHGSTSSSPTMSRKRTILKKPGTTPKTSPTVSRSNTRGKLRFSHVAPEVAVSPLPIPIQTQAPILSQEASEYATTVKGKCKFCKGKSGSSLVNKYRELLSREREALSREREALIRERGSFELERTIWEDERKGYEKKVAHLKKTLAEVLAIGDDGGEDDDVVEENPEERVVKVHESEEDPRPILSATGGLNLAPSSSASNVRDNSLRDTGKEVDRTRMYPQQGSSRGSPWPRNPSGPPTSHAGGMVFPNRHSASAGVEYGNEEGKYWNQYQYLDEYRQNSSSMTAPPNVPSNGSNYNYEGLHSMSSWAGASNTWHGPSVANHGGWGQEGGSSTHGWRQEDINPRASVPVADEIAVFARMYAEASIGIGEPNANLCS